MSDIKYNGWTNYATWRVNLEFCDDICSSLIGEQTFTSVEELAAYLKDDCDGYVDQALGFDADRNVVLKGWLNAFLEDVNWHEIAEANAEELVRAEDEG